MPAPNLIAHKKYMPLDHLESDTWSESTLLVQWMNGMRVEWARAGGGTYNTKIQYLDSRAGYYGPVPVLAVTFVEDRPTDSPMFTDEQIDALEDIRQEGEEQSTHHPREYRDGIKAVLRKLGYRV